MKLTILIAGVSLALGTASHAQLYNYWTEAAIEDAIIQAQEDNEEAIRQAQEENEKAIRSLQIDIDALQFECTEEE